MEDMPAPLIQLDQIEIDSSGGFEVFRSYQGCGL